MNDSNYNPEKILESIYLSREPACGRWEPIETAPKGIDILLYFPMFKQPVKVGYCHHSDWHDEDRWVGDWPILDSLAQQPEPTHWMPLPRAPGSTDVR